MADIRVSVPTSDPYEVVVGDGALGSLAAQVREKRVAVVTDRNVGPLYAGKLVADLEAAGIEAQVLTVDAGESSKSLATLGVLLESMAEAGYGRDSAVIGLGGGVVTDLAGFLAATYMRGVAFYSAPTSLLAMVDAGVGGKTGVNLRAGKNLAGAFWQPRLVAADVSLLSSLPGRQFRLGAVEFFKHALIGLPEQLELLADGRFSPAAAAEDMSAWLAANIGVKAAVVAADERESGVRLHLNYGHTLAHALEAETRHGMEHGEAVAWGIAFAALLSRNRGLLDTVPHAVRLLEFSGASPLPDVTLVALKRFMARDKKNVHGAARMVLLAAPGQPLVVSDVSDSELEEAWEQLRDLRVMA